MSNKLAGKVAIVTGASRGIGRGLAIALAANGAQIAINYKTDRAEAENTLKAVENAGGTGAVFQANIGSKLEFENLVESTCQAFGGLDILVNNAGGASAFMGGSWTIPDKEWHDNFALNLFAAIRLTNAVLPELRASKAAAVVNISSAAATMPFGAFAQYGAAKAALEYYSRTLAMELAPSGIRVNVVSPGVIATPGSAEFAKMTPGFSTDVWIQNIPLGRIGDPEDIAEVVALLASDRGKFITGANYRVDGGMTAR